MKKRTMRDILDCAYQWRSADVHAAACRLGLRVDSSGVADEVAAVKLAKLRAKLDFYKDVYGPV